MKILLDAIQSIREIPDSEGKRFVDLARKREIAKGQYFIREGDRTNKLGYVQSGLFQNVYSTEKGVVCAFSFTAENQFIYECHAMRTNDIARYSVQALEDSVVFIVDYQEWVKHFKDSVWWNKILLELTSAESSSKSDREVRLMTLTGKERYTYFLGKYSHLEHRIKQHITASYLGISPVSLSRIRKNMGLIL